MGTPSIRNSPRNAGTCEAFIGAVLQTLFESSLATATCSNVTMQLYGTNGTQQFQMLKHQARSRRLVRGGALKGLIWFVSLRPTFLERNLWLASLISAVDGWSRRSSDQGLRRVDSVLSKKRV